MKIGLIEQNPPHTKSTYWFMGLGVCGEGEIDEIQVNIPMVDRYRFFPLKHKHVLVRTVVEIEKDSTLDFVIYGWQYIRNGGVPKAVSPCGAIFGGAKRWSFGGKGKEVIDRCSIVFKIACPEDRSVLIDGERRPNRFHSRSKNLSQEQANKIFPLMFIGAWNIKYPISFQTATAPLSFYGSPTSLNRIRTVQILKKKYGSQFVGGLLNRKIVECDEFGNDCSGENISKYFVKPLSRKGYLELMSHTIVNVCPSGLGNSTHRFVDTLCMGGFCLTTTLAGLDYGPLAPVRGLHYDAYREDCSDLLDKAKYYLAHPELAAAIGVAARKHMQQTYLNPGRMAKTYILDKFA